MTELNYPLRAVILAGGLGTRLREVTHGLIPKAAVTIEPSDRTPGYQYLIDVCRYLGITDIALVADTFLEYYQQQLPTNRDVHLIHQHHYPNTGGAIWEAMQTLDAHHQLLLLSSDFIFAPSDLRRLLTAHQPGQLTWATLPLGQPEMAGYEGLLVDTDHQVWGDTQLTPDLTPPAEAQPVTKLGIQIVDPCLVTTALELAATTTDNEHQLFDWYWTLCPLLESHNYHRLVAGQPSHITAVEFAHPALDYGTPERLALARWWTGLLKLYA